ncbi:MAG TPA: hypothetical protein VFE62_09255, partial [Gemmataceae bacterium]|nr:hypothetical protein [Gemmataceae bacterium]
MKRYGQGAAKQFDALAPQPAAKDATLRKVVIRQSGEQAAASRIDRNGHKVITSVTSAVRKAQEQVESNGLTQTSLIVHDGANGARKTALKRPSGEGIPPNPRGSRGISASKAATALARADRALVDCCLAGNRSAWTRLYDQCHSSLLLSIRILLGVNAIHQDLVDEIGAKVWFAVIDRNGQLLGRFDGERGCRLSTFLAGLAKNEISRHFRA